MSITEITSRKAFTLLTGAFILHNIEEAVTLLFKPVENPVSFIQPPTYNQFIFAVSALTIAGIIAYVAAMWSQNIKTYLFISTAVAAALLLNVFIPHVVVAIYTMKYTPGLVTAILLNLPLSLLLLSKNKPFFESRKQMLFYIAIGLAAGYALFALTLILASVLI
jgi:hypothetical protein